MMVIKGGFYADIFPFIDSESDLGLCTARVSVFNDGRIVYQGKEWTADEIDRLHKAFLHALELQAGIEEKS